MQESSQVPQNLLELHESIPLCDLSEDIFLKVLDQQGKVTIVNKTFLVKGAGRLVGLCLRDVRDSSGEVIFKRGNLYTPVGETRETLMDNFGIPNEAEYHYKLKTKEPFLDIPDADWVFLRDNIKKDPAAFMVEIFQKLAKKDFLPDLEQGYKATYEPMQISPYQVKNPLSKKSI